MLQIDKGKIENLAFLVVLVTGIITLYSKFGVLLLFFALIICFASVLKNSHSGTRIDRLIVFLIVFLPFYTLFRIDVVISKFSQYAVIINYFRDIVILLTFFFTIFDRRRLAIDKQDIPFVFFFVVWVFGLVLSIVNGYYLIGLTGLHLSAIPALLYYAYVYGTTRFDTERFIATFQKTSVCVALIGIFAYLFRPPYYCELFQAAGNQVDATKYVRFVSVFFTPNVCGSYLSIAFTIALGKLLNSKDKRSIILLCLYSLCIVLTLSRGSWAFIVSILLVSLMLIRPKAGIAAAAALLFVLVFLRLVGISLFESYIGGVIKDRIFSLLSRSNSSSYGRIDTWLNAFTLLKTSPFGFGMGVSTTAQINIDLDNGIQVIDGFYAKTIIETGFLGLVYCIVLVFWSINKSLFCFRTKNMNEIGIITLLVCIGFFIQSFGSNVFDFVCVAPWFWLILGFSYKEYRKKKTMLVQKKNDLPAG